MDIRVTHIAFFLSLVDDLGQFLIDDIGWWWEGQFWVGGEDFGQKVKLDIVYVALVALFTRVRCAEGRHIGGIESKVDWAEICLDDSLHDRIGSWEHLLLRLCLHGLLNLRRRCHGC